MTECTFLGKLSLKGCCICVILLTVICERAQNRILSIPAGFSHNSCTQLHSRFLPFCVLINSTLCNPPLITSLSIWRCQELFSCSVSELIFAVAKGDIVSELVLNIEINSAAGHLHSSLIS